MNVKQTHTIIFEDLVPSVLPLLKEHIAWTCWYRRPFRLNYQWQIKETGGGGDEENWTNK